MDMYLYTGIFVVVSLSCLTLSFLHTTDVPGTLRRDVEACSLRRFRTLRLEEDGGLWLFTQGAARILRNTVNVSGACEPVSGLGPRAFVSPTNMLRRTSFSLVVIDEAQQWWNPAVEAQATDRAFRIGQERNVFVYRLITQNTFEEKVNDMMKKKQELSDLSVDCGENWIGDLSDTELREMFQHRNAVTL
eukprot:gene24149-29309_t